MNDQTMATEPETIQVQSVMDKEPREIIIDRPALKEDIPQRLIEIDAEIKKLYALRQYLIEKQLSGLPTLTKVINVGGDKPFCRVAMTDNKAPFSEDNSIHRVATFSRYEVKIDYLKNEPKDK